MKTWVIGSSGLIGSAAATRFSAVYDPPIVPWDNPAQAAEVLRVGAGEFREFAGRDSWAILWTAGAAAVSSTEEATALELQTFTAALMQMRERLPSSPGVFLLVSSAGGVYAGSSDPPFTARSPIHPISPYGRLKAAQESTASELLAGYCKTIVARVSNVFGPGQNLSKLQGLVSRAILSSYRRQPLSIFVPLETRRDYIYVDDLSQMLYSLCKATDDVPQELSIEILASGRSISIAEILRTIEEVTRRRVPVALGSHSSSVHQPLDISFTPSKFGSGATTPFAVGVKLVSEDILCRLQRGTLAL